MRIVEPHPIFRASRSVKRSNGSERIIWRAQRNGLECCWIILSMIYQLVSMRQFWSIKPVVDWPFFLSTSILVCTEMELMVAVAGGRKHESLSRKFQGICFSKRNCTAICKPEGFESGRCRGFRRRRFCTRPCPPPSPWVSYAFALHLIVCHQYYEIIRCCTGMSSCFPLPTTACVGKHLQ